MYTRAPEGELAGELGVWRRTVMDPCGPGRTSVSTAPIDGQGPPPSWVWSRRPCAIGTSAPRVGPDGSHASSSGSSVPRPTVSGIFAALYTGTLTPSRCTGDGYLGAGPPPGPQPSQAGSGLRSRRVPGAQIDPSLA